MDVVAAFEEGLERGEREHAEAFAGAGDEQALREQNARLVGPNGWLTKLMKRMPELPPERRRELGQRMNRLKQDIQAAFQARMDALAAAQRAAELSGPSIDVSLPGRGRMPGRLHPLTRVRHDLLDVFATMGFDIADGPEVELHEYNFDKLGFPPDHPATDMQDTFFVAGEGTRPPCPAGKAVGAPPHREVRSAHANDDDRSVVLRTHTSPVQVREMLRRKPPLAVVSAGATFRRDDDATHSPMFMQLEGFMVDEHIHFGHLKGVLTHFLQRVFGRELPVRFRPSYFPFVEPGGEVDMGCTLCHGRDAACRVCKGTGWIEILGCGMIHPVVFEQVGYDAERYTGFAFGLGIDRVAMLRFGIPHLSLLYANDPRFLEQF